MRPAVLPEQRGCLPCTETLPALPGARPPRGQAPPHALLTLPHTRAPPPRGPRPQRQCICFPRRQRPPRVPRGRRPAVRRGAAQALQPPLPLRRKTDSPAGMPKALCGNADAAASAPHHSTNPTVPPPPRLMASGRSTPPAPAAPQAHPAAHRRRAVSKPGCTGNAASVGTRTQRPLNACA
ncbi:MAG: hypothetical protein J3K34DRAFT_433217 [Monoraphidium minutum]|nr:MAG: hypothetical protein J3K34DRAFT_433217 [Monoraphidium minutum]